MRHGRRLNTFGQIAGSEQDCPLLELEWGGALIGARLVAAARVAAGLHMAQKPFENSSAPTSSTPPIAGVIDGANAWRAQP